MRLPFTDENLELEAFKERCDELSENEIQPTCRKWGRWFLEDGMLSTWVITSQSDKNVVDNVYLYQVEYVIIKEQGLERFIDGISQFNWIGKDGIHDLKRAIKYLSKERI